MFVNMVYTCMQTLCKHVFKLQVNTSLNRGGSVKESRVELSVTEGVREGGREFVGY